MSMIWDCTFAQRLDFHLDIYETANPSLSPLRVTIHFNLTIKLMRQRKKWVESLNISLMWPASQGENAHFIPDSSVAGVLVLTSRLSHWGQREARLTLSLLLHLTQWDGCILCLQLTLLMHISWSSSRVKNSGVFLGEMVGAWKEASPVERIGASHRHFRLEVAADSIIVMKVYFFPTIPTFVCVCVCVCVLHTKFRTVGHKPDLGPKPLSAKKNDLPKHSLLSLWQKVWGEACKLDEASNLSSVSTRMRITIPCLAGARTLWRGSAIDYTATSGLFRACWACGHQLAEPLNQ